MSEIQINKAEKKKLEIIKEWLGAGSLNFFGRQFAGKDTQAAAFQPVLNAHILGGGDIIRACIDAGTASKDVQSMINNGELIPSADYESMVLPILSDDKFTGSPLLLSAVGRKFGEEAGVLSVTEATGHPIKAVPYIDISPEESMRRLLASPDRNRVDDTPRGLIKRLQEFDELTVPVLDFYEGLGLLIKVDGMPEANIVFRNLVGALHERAQAA